MIHTATNAMTFTFAYIDPGTGAMVFQMLIAGLLSVGMVFTGIRRRIGGMFRFAGSKMGLCSCAAPAEDVEEDPIAVGGGESQSERKIP